MKNVLVLFLSLTSLVACKKEEDSEDFKVGAYPQTWQLVKSTSSWTNEVKTGKDLPYQEKYTFQADSTFTKIRQQGDQTTEASGTFSVRNQANRIGQYAILTYPEASGIINFCSRGSLREGFDLTSNDTIRGGCEAFDGPRLEYKRVK